MRIKARQLRPELQLMLRGSGYLCDPTRRLRRQPYNVQIPQLSTSVDNTYGGL
jgi:hypothetical protein